MPRRELQQIESSLGFNGTSSRVNIANPTNLATGTAFTIAAWIKPTSFTSARAIYAGNRGGSTNADLEFRLEAATGKLELLKVSVASMGKSTSGLTLNQWTHVAVTYSNPNITFYINAAANGTASSAQTFTSVDKFIGCFVTTAGTVYNDFFAGQISLLYHYPTALTLTDIQNIKAGTPPSGAVGIYRLNEGGDIIANNLTSGGNKGVINAGTWSTDVPAYPLTRTLSPARLVP